MAELSSANALTDYIDALLTDDAPPAAPPDGVVEDRRLRVLCFKAAAIPLAVAMWEVADVCAAEDATLWQDAAATEAMIGTLAYDGDDLNIFDVRRLILPLEHPARAGNDWQKGRILVLVGRGVGLLCDQVDEERRVERGQVAWREQRQSRPWLAGMVEGHALLDVTELLAPSRP